MTMLDLDTERRIQQAELRIRQDRAKRLESVPYEARLWLAVVPAWTLPLAEAVQFPHGSGGIAATLESLTSEGLCEWERDAYGTPDAERRRFWTPARVRPDVLRDVLQDAGSRGIDVARVIGEIGQRISSAASGNHDTPEVVRRWAELARHAPDTAAIAEALERQISECLRGDGDGDGAGLDAVSSSRPDEAMSWVEAARLLGEVVGEAVSAAIRLQSRRIDLVYRQRDDRRHLERFMPRDEPAAAFQRLIALDDDHWALHFVGAGGVGKTMLLRFISGVWAAKAQAVTARIDFDYINPEFPSRAPALLLAHLMQDLRLHAGGAADRTFGSFESKMLALHERARTALASGREVTQSEIDDVVSVFAEAVGMLPRPVVLLLDTCEELAKVRVSGGELPEAVEKTLGILESVHRQVPSARVVFCGRRPLASAGDGWSLPGCPYPARSYLALHELRGFTRNEGERYLNAPTSGVRSDLVKPILDATVDDSPPMGFVLSVPDAKPEPHRYAPFDLSLYARWAREDSTLTKDVIQNGDVDPYIETRVVGRIRRTALRELLPIIAFAGRFDRALLRAASSRPPAEFEDAVRELGEHDWVIKEQGDFFEVKRHLRRRLVAHLRRTGGALASVARDRAADYLVTSTKSTPLASLTISHFEATMRLLEGDTVRAFEWWDAIEERFANGGDLDWAQQLAESLLAETGTMTAETLVGTGPVTVPIRPAILATYASVLMQLGMFTKLGVTWRDVEATASMDPRPDGARRLTLRARAGQVAAARHDASGVAPATLAAFIDDAERALAQPVDDRIAAPLTNAFEALVEMQEVGVSIATNAWVESLARFADAARTADISPEIKGFVAALRARSARYEGLATPARKAWKNALAAVQNSTGRTRQRWLDWHAPDEVAARVRLEFGRAALPALYTAHDAKRKVGTGIPPVASVDADRLASVVLRVSGAQRIPPVGDVRQWVSSFVTGDPAERCNAHRIVEPLFAAYSITEALVYGQVDVAVDDLRARFDQAERSGTQLRTAEALELARLWIARRMRLRDEERVSDSLERLGSDAAYATDLHALAAFDARSRPESRVPADGSPALPTRPEDRDKWLHLYWRSIPATAQDAAAWATNWAGRVNLAAALTPASLDNIMCRLDAIEANLVAERYALTLPFSDLSDRRPAVGDMEGAAVSWMQAHPLEWEAHLRLRLRLAALGLGAGKTHADVEPIGRHMGWRIAAEVALDEGELLALRLPAEAEWMLGVASAWFIRAKDRAAAFLVATSRALAAVACRDTGQLDTALEDVEHRYARLIEGIPEGGDAAKGRRLIAGLPSWQQLTAIAAAPNAKALDALQPLGWRPWLVRLIAAKAWRLDEHRFGERSAIVGDWVKAHYASVPTTPTGATNGVIFPPELAPWTPPATPAPTQAAPVRGAPLPPPAPTKPVPPPEPTAPVPTTDDAHDKTPSLVVRVHGMENTRVLPRALAHVSLLVSSGADRRVEFKGICRGAMDYASVADELLKASALSRDAVPPVGRPDAMILNVDASVASFCWEGIVGALVAGSDRRTPRPAIRTAPALRGAARALPISREVLSIVGDLSLGRLSNDAWYQARDASSTNFDVQLNDGFGLPNVTGDRAPTVLHVIGAPVETGYGDVALEIGRSSGGAQSVIYRDEAPMRAGQLVRTRDLWSRFPGTNVVVLQAYPIAGGKRGPTDQECAGFLRLMACEFAELGASVAMTIPPLPPRDSMSCLTLVGRAVTASAGISRTALLSGLREVQRLVLEHGSLADDDAIASAADFCLYVSPQLTME